MRLVVTFLSLQRLQFRGFDDGNEYVQLFGLILGPLPFFELVLSSVRCGKYESSGDEC